MCGITGIISKKKGADFTPIKAMTDIISHRGPDGEGHYFDEHFAFGHRRLAIVDLSEAGHQPMEYLGRYVITYNGEIYNFPELKSELEGYGYRFNSHTDTEVIMAAYDYWGTACLNKFNGMWAFVIFDKEKKKYFISRDRFGIKPLYYYQDNELFIFASEIKSILEHTSVSAEPNIEYLKSYLNKKPKEYIKETAFHGIFRFPFSSYIELGEEGLFTELFPNVFWNVTPNLSVEKFDQLKANKLAEEYYSLLSDAVRLRLRADVKVGSALSGGLDSSSIVYLVNQQLRAQGREELQETFSSVYKSDGTQDCDESQFIDLLAESLNVNTNQIEPNEFDIPSEHEKMIWFMENPPQSTCMSGWHTFKKVKETDVVVTLDGQGADEQLAGYLGYIHVYLTSLTLLDFYKEMPFFLKIPKAKKHVFVAFLMNHFKAVFGENILKKTVRRLTGRNLTMNLNQKLLEDTQTSLITLIHYSDRVSMAHSIESRMPFMDYRLVEFLASVPAVYKMHNGWTKYLARLAFDQKLPDEICWRKDKMGWPIPENHWFRGGLKNWFISEVSGSTLLSKLVQTNDIKSELEGKNQITDLIRKLNISKFERLFLKK